jgi:hypothetical protein
VENEKQIIQGSRRHAMSRPLTVIKARRRAFWQRMRFHSAISFGLLGASLLVGIWGYEYYEHLPWRDAFLNAAMLLGGMGPVKTDLSQAGKIFAGLYALYAGLVVIAVTGLLLGPGVHHLMHHVHWDDTQDGK